MAEEKTAVVSFEERAKEKMKEIVVDLIPDDRYEQIIRASVAEFERNDLPRLINAELTERYKKLIFDELNKPEYQEIWTPAGKQVSEKLKEIIIESAPLILASLINSQAQMLLANFRDSVMRGNGSHPFY